MKTSRRVLLCLVLLAFVLVSQLAFQNTLTLDADTCGALARGGYYVDRYAQGRGDVYDSSGEIVFANARDETIMRACYNVRGTLPRQSTSSVCAGCAPNGK